MAKLKTRIKKMGDFSGSNRANLSDLPEETVKKCRDMKLRSWLKKVGSELHTVLECPECGWFKDLGSNTVVDSEIKCPCGKTAPHGLLTWAMQYRENIFVIQKICVSGYIERDNTCVRCHTNAADSAKAYYVDFESSSPNIGIRTSSRICGTPHISIIQEDEAYISILDAFRNKEFDDMPHNIKNVLTRGLTDFYMFRLNKVGFASPAIADTPHERLMKKYGKEIGNIVNEETKADFMLPVSYTSDEGLIVYEFKNGTVVKTQRVYSGFTDCRNLKTYYGYPIYYTYYGDKTERFRREYIVKDDSFLILDVVTDIELDRNNRMTSPEVNTTWSAMEVLPTGYPVFFDSVSVKEHGEIKKLLTPNRFNKKERLGFKIGEFNPDVLWMKKLALKEFFKTHTYTEMNTLETYDYITIVRQYPVMETIIKSGFDNLTADLWNDRSNLKILKKGESSIYSLFPYKSKYVLDFLRNRNNGRINGISMVKTLNIIMRYDKNICTNSFQKLVEVGLFNELTHTNDIDRMCEDIDAVMEEVKDWNKFIDYIHAVNLHQCIPSKEALSIWADYITMAKKVGYKLEKNILYPGSLKKEHDIAAFTYNKMEGEIKDREVEKRAEELSKYTLEKNGYIIRPAANASEIISEGRRLHHCVGTYIDKVIKGSTNIFFIRNLELPDAPLYTVELTKTMRVPQIRGLSQARLTDNHKDPVRDLVNTWSKKHNITVRE